VRLAADAFGREDAPIVFGWVMAAHQVGAGIAALGAGIIRTETGAYHMAFLSSGLLCLTAAFLALAIGRRRGWLGTGVPASLPGAPTAGAA
jgi:predicted MFS family arabinose efflux permease